MFGAGGRGDAVLAQVAVEKRDVFGSEPADNPLTKQSAGVGDRGAVTGDCRLLAFKGGEPTVAPVREADRQLRDEFAVVDPRLDLRQRALGLAAVLAGPLSVELACFADDDVVGRPARTGASVGRSVERGPRLAERTGAAVTGLQARHQVCPVGRTTRPPRCVSSTSSRLPDSHASSSSRRKRQRLPPGSRRCGIEPVRVIS